MEVEWIADRAALRSLAQQHPEWTQRELADAVGRSLSWIKKWLKRLREAPPETLSMPEPPAGFWPNLARIFTQKRFWKPLPAS